VIPIIGIMVGCYIVTRMVSFLSRKGERSESGVVVAFSVITLVVTLICIVLLLLSGARSSIPRV